MDINIKMTKEMVDSKKPNSPRVNIVIDGQQIEQLTSYMYLGSLITEDGRSEKEIKRRIMMARSTFTQHENTTIVSRHKPEDQIKSNKMLYLADTILWTITRSQLSRIDAFEMWIYCRGLKISWTEKITSEEVLRRMGTGREIVRQFKTRNLEYLGHLIRHN